MHLYNFNALHLDIIWIKDELCKFLNSFHLFTLSKSKLFSLSPLSLLSPAIFSIFFKLFSATHSLLLWFNCIFMRHYLRYYIKCIKCIIRYCLIQFKTIIFHNDVIDLQHFTNNSRMQLLSTRNINFYRHLSWYKNTSGQWKSTECIKYETIISNTTNMNAKYDYKQHFWTYSHQMFNLENVFYQFKQSIQFYAIFVYIFFILFNIQCVQSKSNISSVENMFDMGILLNYSSNMSSLTSTLSNSSLSINSLTAPSNRTDESLSTDDLVFRFINLLNIKELDFEIPLINISMQSQRTKRSLSFYLSNLGTSPLLLVPLMNNYSVKSRYLSIDNNGTIKLVKSFEDITAMITISVIAEWSPSIHKDQLLKTLQPRDRSKVILRKFAKNICICMYPNGTVYTELIINQTLTDNCEWRLRVSRHGMGFEHKFTEDDISDESTEHFLSNISNKTTIHGGRWPTLSVTDDESYIIASGWAHHLWEPEATWRVYGVQPYIISNFNKTERNSPVFHRFFSNDIQNFKQSNVNKNTSSTSLSLSSSTVKVGSQQMLVLEAPAYYFDTLQHKAKHKYCSILKSKLTHLVQTELVMSLNILDKYRQAFQKFIFHIRTHPATNSKYNNDNNVTINTIADLLDKWLMLLDYKWRQSIRSHYKTNSIFNYHQVNNCSLSFKSSFEINFIGNDSDDKILIKFYEKQLKTKIYFSLFEIVQPIADWTGEQKRQWLRNPRVIKLFHYLHIKCPSLKKLRQASFILRQYLPNYAPEVVIHSKNTFHYGLMGSLETQTFKKLLIHNIKLANKLIDRAIHMKFEEYYFWPILRRINTKRIVEHSIFRNNDIRNEIQKMPLSSICYQLFIRNWKFYKKTDSFSSCFD